MWAALVESCVTVILAQREEALVVLVHIKHPVFDARSRRRSPENFAGLRDEIVNIMKDDAAEADFLSSIYFALNQTIKVMHAYGTTAVSDI